MHKVLSQSNPFLELSLGRKHLQKMKQLLSDEVSFCFSFTKHLNTNI